MKLPKELTTVTPVSKTLALLMFVTLPICAFFIGMNNQQILDGNNQQQYSIPSSLKRIPMPSPIPQAIDTSSWKTYTSSSLGYSIKYPMEMVANTGNNSSFVLYGKPLQQYQTVLGDGMELDLLEISNEVIFKSAAIKNVQDAVKSLENDPHGYPTTVTNITLSNSIPATLVDVKGGQDSIVENVYTIVQFPHGQILEVHVAWTEINKDKYQLLSNQILSTFTFTNQNQTTVTPTCMPKPACLDATPRCLIAEPVQGWCSQ